MAHVVGGEVSTKSLVSLAGLGEILLNDNWTLHGRKAFVDHADPDRKRLPMRLSLWRRHLGPGTDPVDLEAADLALVR